MTRTRKPKAPPDVADPTWPRVWNGGPAQPVGEPALAVELEVRTASESNERGFFKALGRKKRQDQALVDVLTEELVTQPIPAGPWCVRFTRLAPSRLDDDNLAGAFKRLRDMLALVIGIDDGAPAIAFCVAQERRKGPQGVRVEVWGAEGRPS